MVYRLRTSVLIILSVLVLVGLLIPIHANAKTGIVKVGDINIKYNVKGQGDPILLINGFTGNSSSWNPEFLQALEKNHSVITLDNEGSSIKQMAKNTHNLIKELDIKPVVFAHSMGGYIAQELAIRYPDSIDKLVLSSTRCGGDDAIYPTSKQVYDNWEKLISESETLAQHSDAIRNWTTSCDSLDKIKIPTLILTGTNDDIMPPENSEFLDKRIPDSKLVKIKGGEHKLTNQFPEEISEYILKYLNK